MTDPYENIRRALEMGPTPGPWHTGRDGTVWRTRPSELYRNAGRIPGDRPIATIHKDETGFPAEANARLIRACNPDTIRELLAERDQLAAALEAAREDASTERRALLWLAGGDSGASSKAICLHMLGMRSDESFPHDPADLGRCLRMLELFPEWKPRIREMARYSPQWAALVARWDELAEMMADEVGIDWSKGRRAPRTYAAMKAALATKHQEPKKSKAKA